eukprot:GILK01011164.1.p1 GENE.GILK01011164.1~~GILK01011164.1.p1  ORF type:complete len:171 (+),score=19.38 GILK01011164.1:6-518(+)
MTLSKQRTWGGKADFVCWFLLSALMMSHSRCLFVTLVLFGSAVCLTATSLHLAEPVLVQQHGSIFPSSSSPSPSSQSYLSASAETRPPSSQNLSKRFVIEDSSITWHSLFDRVIYENSSRTTPHSKGRGATHTHKPPSTEQDPKSICLSQMICAFFFFVFITAAARAEFF